MKPKRWAKYDYSDKDVWKFRHSAAWTNKAVEIKERDHWMCKLCLSNNIINYRNLEVHHITPLAEDMSMRLDNNNLITLCRSCHEQAEKGNIDKEILLALVEEEKNIPPTCF